MPIQELLDDYNVKYLEGFDKHHREGWRQYNCPFCQSEKWHLGLHLASQYFNCWSCGYHSQKATIRKLIPNISNEELQKALIGTTFLQEVRKNKQENDRVIYPKGIGEFAQVHEQYLKRRQLNPKEIHDVWGVRGICALSSLAWRLFAPVRDINGRDVSWMTRAITDHDIPAYIAAKASQSIISHKHVLYGLEFVTDTAIIVEGIVDAWAIGMGAVCTFGKNPSEEQINQIRRIQRRIICYDPDARDQSRNLCELLKNFAGITEEVVLDQKDPADMSIKERKELREHFFNE